MSDLSVSLVGKTFLVMAGGTGGHVIPALTVAKELIRRGAQVEWLGTRRGIEAKLVPAADIKLNFLDIEGVRGKGKFALLKAPFLLIRAISQALKVIRTLKPNAVLGLGGFASGPGGMAARFSGVPLVIHEQNAVAGTTNKLLAKLAASYRLEAFPGSLKEAEHTGNPVRNEIMKLWAQEQRIGQRLESAQRVRLLVLGGSLGAQAINKMMPAAVRSLASGQDENIDVWHQCGERHLELCRKAYQEEQLVDVQVDAFIQDMAAAYEWADFIVCRAGALTVAEVATAGVGTLLIPFPFAIDDHQTKNGQWLVDAGAAVMVPQSELSSEILAAKLKTILADKQQLVKMAAKGRELAKPNATARIADVCVEACSG